jgi:hypothetical protein
MADVASTPGERWVERYLLPLVNRRLIDNGQRALTCLQIEPDDETEARRLRQEGHRCDVVVLDPNRLESEPWHQPPLVRDDARWLGDAAAYDLILTGCFGRLGAGSASRRALARELGRICRKPGAFLTAIGNRWCPIDFTGNAPRLHGPFHESVVTLAEMEEIFSGAGFSTIHPLTLSGHFEMGRAPNAFALAARALKAYWRSVAIPERRWLYASPLNPTLMLWIEK